MENCLLTKLKVAVNNDNLEKLGVATFRIRSNYSGNLQLQVTKANTCVIEILTEGVTITGKTGDGVLIDSTHAYLPSNSQDGVIISSVNTTVTVAITNKYYIKKIFGFYYDDTNFFSFIKEITVLSLSSAKNTSLLGGLSLLTKLTTLTGANQPMIGNITDLGTCVSLTEVNLSNCPNINGDIIFFVLKQRENTRDTCAGINIHYNAGANVKFNNLSITGSTNKTLSWSPNAENNSYTDISLTGFESITVDENGRVVN